MSSDYIPLEIQAEILKWLPVKPLLQCRSVSKTYKSLIDSPDFIVSYGVHRSPDDRFILRYINGHAEDKYITLVDNEDDGFVQQDFIPTIPKFINNIVLNSVVGMSHGLLCVNSYYYGIVLWNPSIRKIVRIEVSNIYDENLGDAMVQDVIGFGVCPVTFDPIILDIKWIDRSDISVPYKVRVFTLSTGTWSILSANLPRDSIRLGGSQVVIDRFIYWLAFDMLDAEDGRSQSHFLIMSFDLTAKEFKEINLPGSLSNQFCKSISKLRESLVVLGYHREFGGDVSVYPLWMMEKDQGVDCSFTRLYNINVPHATLKRLLGFRKTGELILATKQRYKDTELEIYDPNSKAIYNLGIDGVNLSFFMCSYTESLLLHDHLDGFVYSMTN